MSWIDDPKLARQLARATWLVLVVAGVLLTRFPVAPGVERIALAALLATVVVLNAPVVNGLYQTRDESGSAAWRAVAIALALRIVATAGVLAWVSVS